MYEKDNSEKKKKTYGKRGGGVPRIKLIHKRKTRNATKKYFSRKKKNKE